MLTVTTGARTDFWRETHYGFVRDDGHLRFARVSGDFTAEATVSGDYRELYDQAGLMLRLGDEHWIKAGVEFVGGRRTLSVVVTRERSDWSTVPAFEAPDPVRLRLSRHGTAVRVEWSPAGGSATPCCASLPADRRGVAPGRPDVLLARARGLRGAPQRPPSAIRSPANSTADGFAAQSSRAASLAVEARQAYV